MKKIACATAVLLSIDAAHAEQADIAKLTCADLNDFYLEEIVVVGAWLSGYYNAKRDNTIVDTRQIEGNTAKVVQYCRSNPQVTVMKAIDRLATAR